MVGAGLCWLTYLGQFNENKEPTLGIFALEPGNPQCAAELLTEIIATFVLVIFILVVGDQQGLKASGVTTFLVAMLVVGIGMSLGGPTGYAINPVRDLGPRLVHWLLPIPNRGEHPTGNMRHPIIGPIISRSVTCFYKYAFPVHL